MDLNQIKAVVFDLEGTLLDRVKSREKFIEEQYERFQLLNSCSTSRF